MVEPKSLIISLSREVSSSHDGGNGFYILLCKLDFALLLKHQSRVGGTRRTVHHSSASALRFDATTMPPPASKSKRREGSLSEGYKTESAKKQHCAESAPCIQLLGLLPVCHIDQCHG